MSFRIDDILATKNCEKNEKKTLQENCNILQKTLQRPNWPYHRSISEPYNAPWNYPEKRYHQPHSPDYYNIYRSKAFSYSNLYLRTPSWPNYYNFPLSLVPQYCHLTKRKGGQVRFTASQTDALEKRFSSHKYLSPEDRKTLAETLKLTDRQVKTWFQNRRAKWRRSNSISSEEITSTKVEDKINTNVYKKSEIVIKSHN